jgi:hypothetical protein
MNNTDVIKAMRAAVMSSIKKSVADSLANDTWCSIWEAVRGSVLITVEDSTMNSVRDYFKIR